MLAASQLKFFLLDFCYNAYIRYYSFSAVLLIFPTCGIHFFCSRKGFDLFGSPRVPQAVWVVRDFCALTNGNMASGILMRRVGAPFESLLEVLPHESKIRQPLRAYVQLMFCRGLFCSEKSLD